jgi:hypothetical protein
MSEVPLYREMPTLRPQFRKSVLDGGKILALCMACAPETCTLYALRSVPFNCTGGRRIPTTYGTNQRARIRRFAPTRWWFGAGYRRLADLGEACAGVGGASSARGFAGDIPHSRRRRDFRAKSGHLSVTLSVGTPPMSLQIAYRRVLVLSLKGYSKSLRSRPLCGRGHK